MAVLPVLVLGVGNLSRGDDALAPLLLAFVEKHLSSLAGSIELLTDFQLQVEHALDLQGRDLVLFVDASVSLPCALTLTALSAQRDQSYSSHALSPSAVLAVYQSIHHSPPPPCFLLSIQGECFDLGKGLSPSGEQNFALACDFVLRILQNLTLAYWQGGVVNNTIA